MVLFFLKTKQIMRFSFVTFSLLIFAQIALAQDKPFEKVLGWKSSAWKVRVKSIADSSKLSSCVVIKNDKQLNAFLFDEEMRFKKEFTDAAGEDEFLGGFIGARKIHVYSEFSGFSDIYCTEFNLETGASDQMSIAMDLKGEKILGHLNGRNCFLYITASKKAPLFNVYKFTGGDKMEKISFDLTRNAVAANLLEGSLWKELSSISGLSRSADIAIVDPDVECDADVADSKNKLYLKNNCLVLLMDKAPELLKLISFDLSSKEATYRTIKRSFAPVNLADFNQPDYNSFLLDDHLYSVQAHSDSLNVSVHDFNSGKELKHYRTMAKEPIAFKNTPIVQEGGGSIYSMGTERELDKTKQLLRKMLSGSPVITAVKNRNGQDEVTVGAYKRMTQRAGGFSSMGGMAMGAGMYLTYSPGFTTSWNRVTRFKMLVEHNTGMHVEGEMQQSVAEQIEAYAESIKIPGDGSAVFVANGYHQFAYYDKGEKKLVVVKF